MAPPAEPRDNAPTLTMEVAVALAGTGVHRLLVVDPATTLAGLHHLVQAAMGWSDEQLHLWRCPRNGYAWAPGGYSVARTYDMCDDEAHTHVGMFAEDQLHYEYGLPGPWLCRLECGRPQLAAAGTSGARLLDAYGTTPPEDSGGTWHHPAHTAAELARLYGWKELTNEEVTIDAAQRVAAAAEELPTLSRDQLEALGH